MENEKILDLLKESAQDCHDRGDACPVESEDYLPLKKQEAEDARIILEAEKNRMDHELELEKIKLEREKIQKSNDWKDPKFWIPLVVQTILTFGSIYAYNKVITQHRRETINFEKEGVFTTQAGKSNSGIFKFNIPGPNKGLM